MIFRTKQIFICLGILILAASAVNSFGPASDLKNPILSLDTKNMPLAEVLQEISEVSGYKIVVRGEADISVSLKLKDVGLEEMLRRIFRNLNYALLWDEKEKKVQLSVYGAKGKRRSGRPDSKIRDSVKKSRKNIRPPDTENKEEGDDYDDIFEEERHIEVSVSGRDSRFIQTTPTTAE